MIHLELQPEVELQLAVQAAERGLGFNQYIETIVAAHLVDSVETYFHRPLDEQQLARDLQQGMREIAEGNTISASQVFLDFAKSMAYEVRLSRQASRDLDDLYEEKQVEVSDAAVAWNLGLEAAVLSLWEMPQRGFRLRRISLSGNFFTAESLMSIESSTPSMSSWAGSMLRRFGMAHGSRCQSDEQLAFTR